MLQEDLGLTDWVRQEAEVSRGGLRALLISLGTLLVIYAAAGFVLVRLGTF